MAKTVPLANSVNLLDKMIANLEDASGERGLRINPDDPWARHHLKSFDANNTNVSVRACSNGCGYKLTSPFETRCPFCDFGDQKDQFALLSVEEILAALPKERPPPEKKESDNKPKGAPKGKKK